MSLSEEKRCSRNVFHHSLGKVLFLPISNHHRRCPLHPVVSARYAFQIICRTLFNPPDASATGPPFILHTINATTCVATHHVLEWIITLTAFPSSEDFFFFRFYAHKLLPPARDAARSGFLLPVTGERSPAFSCTFITAGCGRLMVSKVTSPLAPLQKALIADTV